jgi:threonylcarbamoyladenosine tRNA methylthiotransferase MtaB
MAPSDPSQMGHDPIVTRSDPKMVTFGCRLNIHESEIIRAHARRAGLENVIIFNTCAVTKEAERQARQAIRKARSENPTARIIVTGCVAQIDPQTYTQMPEVDQIIGNDRKLLPEVWAGHDPPVTRVMTQSLPEEPDSFAVPSLNGFESQTRGFVQVQNGCDHRCTFCIIPYGRGPSRSVPVGGIVHQVQTLVQNGYREIVLTGVDLTSYGKDLPGAPPLGQMIRRLLALVPDLPRLRLSSLDPGAFDPDLWRLIADEPRLMPHLHLSVQAGDDLTLKRMKRRHSREDVMNLCQKARDLRPDLLFGADLIAGFPTETEAMFENTLHLVESCDLSFLHVFPYSARTGTPAAKMPQIPMPTRKARAERLRQAGEENLRKALIKNISKDLQVLSEKGLSGHADNFLPVRFVHDIEPGRVLKVHVLGVEDGRLQVRALFP